jgi:hypothetical protein
VDWDGPVGLRLNPETPKVGKFFVLADRIEHPDRLGAEWQDSSDKEDAWRQNFEDKRNTPAGEALWAYYSEDGNASELNNALRSGRGDEPDVKEQLQLICQMSVDVPRGMAVNRCLATEGFGGRVRSGEQFAEMKQQLKQLGVGTILMEPGLMSTSPGDDPHGEFGDERTGEINAAIVFQMTTGDRVRAMPIFEGFAEPKPINEWTFPPNQKMVILSLEESENAHVNALADVAPQEHAALLDKHSSAAKTLVVEVVLLPTTGLPEPGSPQSASPP